MNIPRPKRTTPAKALEGAATMIKKHVTRKGYFDKNPGGGKDARKYKKIKPKSKDVADLSGKRKDKYKVLDKTRVKLPSGKFKPVRKTPILSRMYETSQTKEGPKLTAYSVKAHDQDRSTEPTKFKDIDSRTYGLKGGGKVRLARKGGGRAYGRNS